MSDRPLILGGLVVFLVAVTLPVWYNLAAGATAEGPSIVMPKTEKACVEPRAYMRASHATLLAAWREDVVRGQARTYTAQDGRRYTKSLAGTCLKCHESRADFCDRCHDYAGVSMTCSDCHAAEAAKPGQGLFSAGVRR